MEKIDNKSDFDGKGLRWVLGAISITFVGGMCLGACALADAAKDVVCNKAIEKYDDCVEEAGGNVLSEVACETALYVGCGKCKAAQATLATCLDNAETDGQEKACQIKVDMACAEPEEGESEGDSPYDPENCPPGLEQICFCGAGEVECPEGYACDLQTESCQPDDDDDGEPDPFTPTTSDSAGEQGEGDGSGGNTPTTGDDTEGGNDTESPPTTGEEPTVDYCELTEEQKLDETNGDPECEAQTNFYGKPYKVNCFYEEGMVFDIEEHCSPLEWVGDGQYCDPAFKCVKFNFDCFDGDCSDGENVVRMGRPQPGTLEDVVKMVMKWAA